MFRDYLRSFWRGILNNKIATLINVGGLAMGLAVFFVLTFYVYREFSWDAHWKDADRIFVSTQAIENAAGSTQFGTGAPYVLGATLQERHAGEIEAYARVYLATSTPVLTVAGAEYPFVPRYHVEPALLDLFPLEVLQGSFAEVFADPRAIAISDQSAERYFGEESPLGRTVTFSAQKGSSPAQASPPDDFVIRAVYRVPDPSTLAVMQFIALFDPLVTPPPGYRLDIWQFIQPQTPPQPGQPRPLTQQPLSVSHYLKVREGVDIDAIQAGLRAFMDENRLMDNGASKTRYLFPNIQGLHLAPSPTQVGDNVQRLWVYAAVGVLVLLISGCNFVMLATLRLVDRMREVGIRKSVGGGGGQLLRQYLLDAFLHIFAAATFAVLFTGLAFPKLAVLLQIPIRVEILTAHNLALCLLMVVLFTVISSSYPAWLTSQTKPGPLLRNGAGAVIGTGTSIRKILVGLQFALVVVLLLASAVVRQQIEYTSTRDRGYSLENVISLRPSASADMARLPAMVTEFRKVPGVEAATGSVIGPGQLFTSVTTLVRTFEEDGSVREVGLQQRPAAPDFFRTMSVPILAGREYTPELDGEAMMGGQIPADPAAPRNVILNASATRLLGFADPESAVEQLLEFDVPAPDRQVRKQILRVIGVVGDTQMASAMLPPVPEFYMLSPQAFSVSVKAAANADMEEVTKGLAAIWDTATNGASPFIPQDTGSIGAFQLQREQFEARIITYSTGLAIVIALLGLYGLVAATVVKRVKEIGVRKVMGAERRNIVTLFLLQFSKPIVIANLVAWPFGFWAIRQWLTRFPYQLDTLVIVLSGLAASLVALLIAWLTVGTMAARAASVNPVKALRYE